MEPKSARRGEGAKRPSRSAIRARGVSAETLLAFLHSSFHSSGKEGEAQATKAAAFSPVISKKAEARRPITRRKSEEIVDRGRKKAWRTRFESRARFQGFDFYHATLFLRHTATRLPLGPLSTVILARRETRRRERQLETARTIFLPSTATRVDEGFLDVAHLHREDGEGGGGGGKRRDFSRGGGVSFFLFVRQGFVVRHSCCSSFEWPSGHGRLFARGDIFLGSGFGRAVC